MSLRIGKIGLQISKEAGVLFLDKLKEKQSDKSGETFAQELGISPSLWSLVKAGRRVPSRKVVNAALARWPELAYYLAEDARAGRNGNGGQAA
jgi:hypothetical protein